MEIRKLEAFCNVVELKSFTRAAEAMFLSQPTISDHVRSLEEELGQKLLDRFGREVKVTPAGDLLYGYARKIIRIRSEAVQAVQQYGGKQVGRIIVGASTIPGSYILPALIGEFRTEYPAIKATLAIHSSRTISKQVLAGELDLGVVGAKWHNSGLTWQEIFADRLIMVATHDHPWAEKESISLTDVMKEPFIIRETESGTRKVFAEILAKNGYKESDLPEVAEIGSTAAIKEAVKAGVGVSVLSKYAVKDDLACGKLVCIELSENKMYRPFYLVQRKNRALSPIASLFYEYLIKLGTYEPVP